MSFVKKLRVQALLPN